MKLLVLDLEGTIFRTDIRLPGTSISSTIWQGIAHALGPQAVKEEVATHGVKKGVKKGTGYFSFRFLPSVITSCYGAAATLRRRREIQNWNRHEPVKLMLDAVIAVITKGEKVLLIQRAAGTRGGGH